MPEDSYDYLANIYGYESNYIRMKKYESNISLNYGCWVLSQKEIENYKEKFPNKQHDLIYKILSKETDPLKIVKYLKKHSSLCFQDTKLFKEITL